MPFEKGNEIGRETRITAESREPAPSAWEPWMDEKACELAAKGTPLVDIAGALGVHWRTLYQWKKAGGRFYIQSFAEALIEGRSVVQETVVSAMVRRARGYEIEAVHFSAFQGEVTATRYMEHYPPEVGAAKMLLAAWDPETYGDRSKVDVTSNGKDVGQGFDLSRIPVAEREAMLRTMEKALDAPDTASDTD